MRCRVQANRFLRKTVFESAICEMGSGTTPTLFCTTTFNIPAFCTAPTFLPPMEANLLAMASGQTTMDQLGFFEIRNALALASTTRYITSVINNGSRK